MTNLSSLGESYVNLLCYVNYEFQAGPIPTGNLKTFVARQANKVTDLGSSGVIDRLCRKATSRGMAFSVVAGKHLIV